MRDRPGSTPDRRMKSDSYVRAFDEVAEDYDSSFASRSDVRRLRAAVWKELLTRIQPGSRVLDLGCGTGEDALFLAEQGFKVWAVDASPRMVETAREKLSGCRDRVRLVLCDAQDLHEAFNFPSEFQAILANFGSLNTFSRLEPLRILADRCLDPGGFLLICLINRYFAREFLRGEFRRLKPNGTPVRCGSCRTPLYYHPLRSLVWAGYRLQSVQGLSVFSGADVRKAWPLNRLGDHTLIVLRKEQ